MVAWEQEYAPVLDCIERVQQRTVDDTGRDSHLPIAAVT